NQAIKNNPEKAIGIVQEMNRCLFHNFKLFDSETRLKTDLAVPSISKNGEIRKSSDLVFSDTYPSAKGTEEIFDGIYQLKYYVADPYELGLKDYSDDLQELERYLEWIGVNRFANYIR